VGTISLSLRGPFDYIEMQPTYQLIKQVVLINLRLINNL